MKNWLTQTFGLAIVAAFTFTSCEKDEVKATLTPATTPTLTTSTNTVVLQQTDSAKTALTLNWTPVTYNWSNTDYNATPAVSYGLEIDKKGNNFAKPVTIDLGTTTSKILTVWSLNETLNGLGLASGVASDLEVRLKSYVAVNSAQYSSATTLKATPFKVCLAPNSDKWAIIGDAAEGWSTDIALTYNCDTKTYNITRTLKAGPFKFRKNKDWPGNLGDNGADTTLEPDGANIAVPSDGTYTIALNLAGTTPTYTLTKK